MPRSDEKIANHGPIFYDPKGRRPRLVSRGAAAAGLALAVAGTLFGLSLLAIPFLPRIPGLSGPIHHHVHLLPFPAPKRQVRLNQYLFHKAQVELGKEISRTRRLQKKKREAFTLRPGERVVAAFYAPWQETGLHSLRANADRLTLLMPEWLHLSRDGNSLDLRDWDTTMTPHNKDVIQIARDHRIQIHPLLNNSEEGRFDPARVHRLLASTSVQEAVADSVRLWLLTNGFGGLNVDLENLYPEDYARVPGFLHLLGDVLHKDGLALSTDVEAENEKVPWKEIASLSDLVILMAYDEHYSGGDPGPIASQGWFEMALARALKEVPPDQLVIGIGNYAYDWAENRRPAEALSYQSALILARDFHEGQPIPQIVDYDSLALNPTFEYQDDAGANHEVWMLDAVTAYNQWRTARRANVRGAAIWALGSEDPGLWTFFSPKGLDSLPPVQALETLDFPYDIEYEGEGEILSVLSLPQEGKRRVTVDDSTGLITDMVYLAFPSSYVIKRSGYHPGCIALTFDDGPHPKYTPEVLDLLNRTGVRATFFVIGEQAEEHPELIRKLWREGHEIGSHTFTHPNMGAVGLRRADLELNATQRALESILGRSTILFRVPYNADAEPVSEEEIRPILEASKLGYLTVGELIDPQDWNLWRTAPDGRKYRRRTEELVQDVLAGIHSVQGNVVLLHDGGGDRSQTVQALGVLIPALQQQGYRFVTVSELMGLSRDAVMPPLSPRDRLLTQFDRTIFETVFTFETLLGWAFFGAILLGIARALFVAALALTSQFKVRQIPESQVRPLVSVIIAAYNEQPVIARTLESILASDYPSLEIIVVDDGSRDGTGDEVEKRFRTQPKVRLIRQANSGKGSALNRGVEQAKGEILVCLDADTQIHPQAISYLVRPFTDDQVGATAGNVKVGNRINILTRWQALEYIISQNLDRRAYSLLNAITVVPGAIGAWRKRAVLEAGGYVADTLAEDMDLTWRMRRNGWRVVTVNDALGYTEAPDTVRAFFKQRFRWAFGTLQCLWKHRSALGRYGWFGWLALPSLWVFQVLFQALAPLVDLQLLYTLATFTNSWLTRGIYNQDWQPLPEATHLLWQVGFYYALFFVVELLLAFIAFRMDKERLRLLWWLFWQKFVYRQLMYAVIWKSMWRAIQGLREGWGKLQRKGTVQGVVSQTN